MIDHQQLLLVYNGFKTEDFSVGDEEEAKGAGHKFNNVVIFWNLNNSLLINPSFWPPFIFILSLNDLGTYSGKVKKCIDFESLHPHQ